MQFQIEIDEEEVLAHFQDWDPRITMSMVMTHVLSQKDLVLAIAQWGIGDTDVGDRCLDRLSEKITGLSYPKCGDSDSYKANHQTQWDLAMETP